MISTPIVAAFAVFAALSIIWPVAIFVICRRRMTLAGRNILIGAGVFFVFSQVLEKAMHLYLLQLNPATATWLNGSAIVYALYGCLAAALFEEIGRYLGMRLLVRPTGNPGTAVAYGIGHGGLEAILIGSVTGLSLFVYAILLNSGHFDALLGQGVPPKALVQLRAGLQHQTMMPLLLGSAERLGAMLCQIGLSLVVWRAVERRRLAWLGLAVVLHAAIDFFAALAQKGSIWASQVNVGLMLVIIVALGLVFLRALPGKASAPALRHAETAA
jgi:uncharacterized membrane protein YhfC